MKTPPRRSLQFLFGLQAFLAVTGLVGGVYMMLDKLGMPDSWLEASGFDSWVLPGLALFVFMGVGNLVAAIATLRRHRWFRNLAIADGVGVMAWIIVQVAWIQKFNPLQPTIFIIGLAIFLIGLRTNHAAISK